MPQYKVSLKRFDGGLNTKASPVQLTPDQSPDLQNVVFDDEGAVQTRKGCTLFNTSSMGTAPVDLLHSFVQNNSTRQLMAICNSSLFKASGTAMVKVATDVFTAGINVQAVTYQNRMFMSNGYQKPYKWDGTSFTQWGVPTVSAPTGTVTTVGVLNGAYRYAISGVNSFAAEGNYGTKSTYITAVSNTITLTDIPIFPASSGVGEVQICRNTAGVSGVFYVVTSITNGVTSYVDNHTDGTLVTLAKADNNVPPYFTCMCPHLGYMFGASKSSTYPMFLYYSLINEPEIFQSEDYIRIDDGDGALITGLITLSGGLIISKDDGQGNGSLYVLSTPDATPTNWRVIKLDTSSGSQSAKALTKFGSSISYMNRFGIFDLSETETGLIKADPLSYNIEADIFTLSTDYLYKVVAIAWKNKLWISVPYGATQTTNNRIYQFDYVRGRNSTDREIGGWSRFTNHSIADFTIHNGDLYGGSSASDGFIYKLDTGYVDNVTEIDSYFKTIPVSGLKEHQFNTKVWRYAYVTVECTGDWFMEISYLNDFHDEAGNAISVSLDPGGEEWGTAIMGQTVLGPGIERKRVKINFTNSVSKSIQLKFATNTTSQYFKVHEVEVFYNLRSLRTSN